MNQDDIELDIGESPLTAVPVGAEGDAEVEAAAAQAFIGGPGFTDPEGIPVIFARNEEEQNQIEEIATAAERIRAKGRVCKMDIEQVRAFSKESFPKIPSSMFTDVPMPVNVKRALESMDAEVDARQMSVRTGVQGLIKNTMDILAQAAIDQGEQTAQAYLSYTSAAATFLKTQGKSVSEVTSFVGDVGTLEIDPEQGSTPMRRLVAVLTKFGAGPGARLFLNYLAGRENPVVASGTSAMYLGRFIEEGVINTFTASASRMEREVDSADLLVALSGGNFGTVIGKLRQAAERLINDLRELHSLAEQGPDYKTACLLADRANSLATFGQAILNAQKTVQAVADAGVQYINDFLSTELDQGTPSPLTSRSDLATKRFMNKAISLAQ